MSKIPYHPAHTLKAENAAITVHINERVRPLLSQVLAGKLAPQTLLPEIGSLLAIDLHYSRKENLFFPILSSTASQPRRRSCGVWTTKSECC
ncbi:MAG: hypothetical protein R2881_04510 [Eubacteriales bacterium]